MAEEFWLQNPVARSFFITDRFNTDRPYGNGKHEGLDLAATDNSGNPVAVLAAQRGVVTKTASIPTGYGTYVIVRHDWPDDHVYVTWYGHMSRIDVAQGDVVNAGQQLGLAGSTGNSTGIHLHLTLQHLGHGLSGYVVPDVVDPLPYFVDAAPKVLEAMFVADETVPDGTSFQPGMTFTKTWRLRNSGTIPWGTGSTLAFFSGDPLGASSSVPLPDVPLGTDVLISVQMTAPANAGRYRSYWKPRDQNGNFFEMIIWAEIVVAGTAVVDDARLVEDIPVPDALALSPGQTFLKQWKVRNAGSTAWRSGYQLDYVGDEKMGAPDSVEVPYTKSGEEAIVGVTLKAPSIPGTYRSSWQMMNLQGQNFGEVFYTNIKVVAQAEQPVDILTYVDDVTFEEGARVEPGQMLNKIWRVRNAGTTTWGSGYVLAFERGDQMGAPASVALPAIQPGETADVTVGLTAPTVDGEYNSVWAPWNANGEKFLNEVFTKIVVVNLANPGDLVDDAKFERDVTIPDGTSIQAGAIFLKTWRVRNAGTTTWKKDQYSLSYKRNEQMGGAVGNPLSRMVEPGEVIDISVSLTAPASPGTYKSTWQLKNSQGVFFGHQFYTIIKVPSTVPPTADNRALFLSHETYPLDTTVRPGQAIEKIWRVRNIGKSTWGAGYTLAFVQGAQMGGPNSISIPATITNQVVRLRVNLRAPTISGTYKGYWQLRDPRGQFFGPKLVVWIKVKK